MPGFFAFDDRPEGSVSVLASHPSQETRWMGHQFHLDWGDLLVTGRCGGCLQFSDGLKP